MDHDKMRKLKKDDATILFLIPIDFRNLIFFPKWPQQLSPMTLGILYTIKPCRCHLSES